MYFKYPWVVLWLLLSFVLVTIYHVKTTDRHLLSGADSMRLPRFGRFVSWWSCDFARGDKWKGWLQETFIVHHTLWHGKIRPPKKDWQVALVPWWFFKGFSHFFRVVFKWVWQTSLHVESYVDMLRGALLRPTILRWGWIILLKGIIKCQPLFGGHQTWC